MKRLTINVDLEDNEVFDKEVKEIIIAQSKQIARESVENELRKEIERLVKNEVEKVAESNWYNPVRDRVVIEVSKKMIRELSISKEDLDDVVGKKVTKYLNDKVIHSRGIEGFIQDVLKKSIASLLKEQ